MIRFQPHRKKQSHGLAIVLILLALFFSFSAFRPIFGLRPVLLNVFFPFQYVATGVWNGLTAVPASVINLTRLSSENSRLSLELKELKLKQAAFEKLQKENESLRAALNFRRRSPYQYRFAAAQVIGRSPAPWFSIIEIDQGRLAGIREGLPVVALDGVVGRVIEAGELTSKIALIIDPASSVAAQCLESGDLGVVAGRSGSGLTMKYVGVGGRVKAGERVVTSSVSQVYPPGLPLGTVTLANKREHDLFYKIEIKPAVDFGKLSHVFVIIK